MTKQTKKASAQVALPETALPSASRFILDNLISVADGLARHFGNDCEICIHDLAAAEPEHTIVYIINGHVSGRKIGDSASKVVLESLEMIKKGVLPSNHLAYLTHTASGKTLKSSTMYIKDLNGQYRYILSINYDITSFISMEAALRNLTAAEADSDAAHASSIPVNVNELLDSMLEQSVQLIGKAPALMTKDEKIRAIQFLNDAGVFLITKSGDKVSNFFGISKFTLYSYIGSK